MRNKNIWHFWEEILYEFLTLLRSKQALKPSEIELFSALYEIVCCHIGEILFSVARIYGDVVINESEIFVSKLKSISGTEGIRDIAIFDGLRTVSKGYVSMVRFRSVFLNFLSEMQCLQFPFGD